MMTADGSASQNVAYRVRAAVSGVAVTMALLATTAPTWVVDTGQPEINWNLWAVAAGARSGIEPPVEGTQVWGRFMVLVLVIVAIIALVAAAEATFGWSVATVAAAVVAFLIEIGFHFGARDLIVDNDYHYTISGSGATAVLWLTGVVIAWAGLMAFLAKVHPFATTSPEPVDH